MAERNRARSKTHVAARPRRPIAANSTSSARDSRVGRSRVLSTGAQPKRGLPRSSRERATRRTESLRTDGRRRERLRRVVRRLGQNGIQHRRSPSPAPQRPKGHRITRVFVSSLGTGSATTWTRAETSRANGAALFASFRDGVRRLLFEENRLPNMPSALPPGSPKLETEEEFQVWEKPVFQKPENPKEGSSSRHAGRAVSPGENRRVPVHLQGQSRRAPQVYTRRGRHTRRRLHVCLELNPQARSEQDCERANAPWQSDIGAAE